jgi:hypothetical protein
MDLARTTTDEGSRPMSVRDALARYLDENGFTTASYTDPKVTIRVFGRDVVIPNGKGRQEAIPLHDLHHVATGFGTDLVGEAEIGAYELAAGCSHAIVYWLNGVAVLIGLFLAPRRVLRAARRGFALRTLYRTPRDYEGWLSLSVEALRDLLGMPREGLAEHPPGLHDAAPARLPAPDE